jgi:molybdopterin molybdotransferase
MLKAKERISVFKNHADIIENSKNFDVIITTGGTAISKGDVVVDAVNEV